MDNKNKMIQAINEKRIVEVEFDSKEKGVIKRKCIPFDYGPSRRNLVPNPERYHFYDLESPDGNHTLSILPEQLISLYLLNENFDPTDYVTWSPVHWFIARNWGRFS